MPTGNQNEKWVNAGTFKGFQTLYDPSKIIDGANPAGQNTSILEGDRVSARPYGYETFSTPVATPSDYGGVAFISSLHTFRKRSGQQIMMRGLDTTTFGSLLQFLDATSGQWQTLFSTGSLVFNPFGYTDFNVNSDQNSYVYFCNGSTPLLRWNGAYAEFVSSSNAAGYIAGFATIPTGVGNLGTDAGYLAGDTADVDGGVPGVANIVITSTANGGINTFTLANAGTGYSIGDILLIVDPSGPQNGNLSVSTVDGGGGILTAAINDGGINYIAGNTYQLVGSLGSGALIQVTAIDPGGIITAFTITNPGAGYSPADVVSVSPGQNGLFQVDTVGGGGDILTFHQTGRGTGYVPGSTYNDIASGNQDAQITVNSVYNGYVTSFSLAHNANAYPTGVTSTSNTSGGGNNLLTVDITSLSNNTITINQNQDVGILAAIGDVFYPSGNLIIEDSTQPLNPNARVVYTYTDILGDTFVGVSPDPTLTPHTAGDTVFQQPEFITGAPSGNILLTASNRIFVSGELINPQLVYFSEYGNAQNWGTTLISVGTATSPGIFNLSEGGGGVSNMILQEGSIYMFKRAIVYEATLSDSFYTLVPLKPFDQNSRTMGAFKGTVFTSSNMVFLATPDNQILGLERVAQIDYPQATSISYPIKPTIESYDLRRMKGISFNNKVFMTMSSLSGAGIANVFPTDGTSVGNNNDRVLIWNTVTKTFDSPIVGWNASCWTIYDDGHGDNLYFGDDVSPNVYKVTSTPTDGEFPVTAVWPSKRYDFGSPADRKRCTNFFVYGRMLPSTILTVKVYFDENGSTQTYTGSISGTDTKKLFGTVDNNAFGENPFGVQVFGDQADSTGMRYFRVYFVNKVRVVPFYNIQMEFSSAGFNQQWEVLDYSFEAGPYENLEDRNLYSDFTPA